MTMGLGTACDYHIYLNVRQGFLLKFGAYMSHHLKITHKVPNWSTPNWIALEQTIRSQTKVCNIKLSCGICALVRCYTG